jgi:RHS repeat-associated protein
VNVDTTIDTTGPSPLYSQKSQSVDQYGNVTQSSVWDWNSTQPSTTSGWTRQYNSTFQNACSSPFTGASGSNCAYVNRFVLNLLSTQKLTDSAGNSVTLATNTYDGYQTHAMLAVTGITEFDTSYSTSFLTRGNLTTSVAPSGTTNTYYDQTGMSTGADDGNGHAVAVTQAAGTNNSAPGLIQPNTGGSNDANLATSMTYSSFLGVASATTPNSSLTTIAYDSYGRPLTAVAPTGASTGYAYAFGATANGNISDGAYTTTATTNYHWTKTVTDGLGRTANSMAGYLTGGTPTQVSQVDTYYEACACSPAGKAWKISQPYAPAGTQAFTTYTYDALGRPLTVTLPDGASKTTYSYAGNWTSVVDPAGNWKQYETDVFGNTLEVVEPDPGYSPLVTSPPATPGTGSGILVTNYTYDFVSHLTNVSMVRAGTTQTRTWTYSPTTLLLSNTTSPETGTASANGTTSYTYNADGTLITRTDPLGQVTTYSYDSYQRVTQVTHGSDATQTYNYTYDTGTNGFGRLTQVTWGGTCSGTIPVYTETYSYTVAGQVSGKTLTVAKMVHGGCVQATATGAFAYDNEGKPTGTTYPEFITGLTGPTATYSYDNMSRLTGVTDTNELDVTACTSGAGSVIWASGGTYNAAGQLVGVQRLQSVSGCAPATPLYFNQAWTYNGLNQLTAIETSTQSNGYPTGSTNPGMAGTFFAQYFYSSTQNNGQIGSMTDARTGNTVSYTYDLLKRVTGATATGGTAWNQTFGYDGFGNLTSKSVPSGSSEFPLPGVNAAKNWLNGSSYDADGNVLTLNNATLGYDMENRLHNYTTGTFVENYAYDEGNKRVEKYSASSDVVYFYGPDGKLLSVLKVNILANSPWMTLSTVTNRIYFGGMLLGTSTGYASGDSDLIKDRLGSAKPSYPYGTDIGTQAGDGDDFATYWKDASSGFEYAMNRYYSAAYGRFLTVDPFGGSAKAGAPGSWNRYAYTSGDPANGNDPGGLDSEVCVSQDGSYAPPQCYMIADGASYQLCPTCYVTSTTNTESVTVDGGPPDQVPYDASANPSDLGVSGSAPGSNGSQGGSAGVGAVGGQVYLICQPVTTGIAWQDTVACVFNLQHCWLSTGTVAAGMGPADNGPLPNNPLGIPVAITDQSGQGGGNATLLPNVDPACVNAALQIGKPLGTWGPTNNCNTFAQSVISSCQIPGTKPPPCQIGLASCSAAFWHQWCWS